MKFDVFLSHNGKDKPAVENLAHKLEGKGLKVWLDKWNLIPGNPWEEEIEDALDQCQTFAVFVGPSGMGPWESEEMRSALEDRVQDRNRRVIPVLLPGAPDNKTLKLPRFLRRTTWVDFRAGLDDADALYRVECGIKGIPPGKSVKVESTTPLINDALSPVGDLPIGSYLPFPPNPLFEGRVDDLKKLAESLLNDSNTGMIVNQKAITGMGGLGKTQLAVEFAYRYGRYYRGVHWLNLADHTLLDSEIPRCGIEMALANWPDDQPSQVTFTINSWKSDGPRLLVLDNFEDVEKVNSILPRLRHSNLRLLITSRRMDWPTTAGLSSLPLELFSPEESLAFLKKALDKRKDKDEDFTTLAERLGNLPLALELASRYLNAHSRLSVDKYLVQAKEAFDHPSMRDWRKDLPAPTQHDLDLQRTFAVSWEALKDETAKPLFQMTGYLAPNTPIQHEIFEKALEISSDVCDEILNVLYGLGLLRKSEDDLPTIHPLLAEYAYGLAKEKKEILEDLANALTTLANEANQTGLPFRLAPLRSHISVIASHAEEAGLQSAGKLWNFYGSHSQDIADYSSARIAYERALKIDSGNTIYINNLGDVLRDQGDLAGARTMFERALKIDEAAFGPDHPKVAIRVNNLGTVLYHSGDLVGARTMFERALKNGEAAFGPDDQNVALRANNLGLVMKKQGDLAGARAMYERALKIDEDYWGSDHPQVAIDVNNLAGLYYALGDLAVARTMFERALKIDEASFGPDHPRVASDVNNLAMVLADSGDLGGARAMYKRALVIFKKFLPLDHPNIKTVQENLDSLK